MSAFTEDSYQPPDREMAVPDSVNDLVAATDSGSEQRRAGEKPVPSWMDLDDGRRKVLTDDFVEWFQT